jgi:Peptidase M15
MSRAGRILASLSVLALAGVWAAPGAHAATSLLDEPPRVCAFKLDDLSATRLTLLESFHEAAAEHPGGDRRYLSGAWARWRAEPWWKLAWISAPSDGDPPAQLGLARAIALEDAAEPEEPSFGFEPRGAAASPIPGLAPVPRWMRAVSPGFATTGLSFASNGFDALWSLPPSKPVRDWRCRRRPVRFVRYNAETDMFPLLRCDGTVAPQALDRLTFMARVPEAARPGELLPDDPDPASIAKGEWLPGVHVVHPRLLWALQRVADAFPWRNVYVFSGYRPKPPGAKPGGHHSMHGEARAMDISVQGVRNEELFEICRKLDDIGCGFYPNSKFVHVDVRRPGTGHAFWIDISSPGEPSHYVDSWPGVIEAGALVWDPSRRESPGSPPGDPSCTHRADGR